LAAKYCEQARVVLLVYDCSDKFGLDSASYWVSEIRNQESKIFVLVGTKYDFDEDKRKLPETNINEFLEKYHINFHFKTSAKMNENISVLFETISQVLVEDT